MTRDLYDWQGREDQQLVGEDDNVPNYFLFFITTLLHRPLFYGQMIVEKGDTYEVPICHTHQFLLNAE
jgi:hypothetical protein